MDRRTLGGRLPGDRIRQRLPVGRPGEDETDGDHAEGISIPKPDLADDRNRNRVRVGLLALAGLGAVVTLVAVIARFLLGSDNDDDEDDPETVGDEQGIEEGTAAMIGMAFLLGVAVVRRWLDEPGE